MSFQRVKYFVSSNLFLCFLLSLA